LRQIEDIIGDGRVDGSARPGRLRRLSSAPARQYRHPASLAQDRSTPARVMKTPANSTP